MGRLFRTIYCSSLSLGHGTTSLEEELRSILARSRDRNLKARITGALMLDGETFSQVLEGPEDAVRTTFTRISKDPRHRDVTVLQAGPIPVRDFADWSMAWIGDESGRGGLADGDLAADTRRQSAAGLRMLDILRAVAANGPPAGNPGAPDEGQAT